MKNINLWQISSLTASIVFVVLVKQFYSLENSVKAKCFIISDLPLLFIDHLDYSELISYLMT